MAPAPRRPPAPAFMWPAALEPLEEVDAAEPEAEAPEPPVEAAVGLGVDLITEVRPDEISTVWVWFPTMTVLRPVVRPA
jgi:hypothetical protein